MLAFANRLLFEYKDLPKILSSRFPVVLIDEAQDTNKSQSRLLATLFDPQTCVVQRFGDTDQQIFDFGDPAVTDAFPVRYKNELILNETQRCNPYVSGVASKFSLSGINIVSVVEVNDRQPLPHLILFDESTSNKVIKRFAELVSSNIVDLPKDATIKAIGQIGQGKLDEKKFPQTICHYEPTYIKPGNPRLGRPKNLQELIKNTRVLFAESGENYYSLNMFFAGILRLLADELKINYGTPYPFRNVTKQLLAEEFNLREKGLELYSGLMAVYNEIITSEIGYLQIKQKIEELLNRTEFRKHNKSFLNNFTLSNMEQNNSITVSDTPIELNTIAGIKGETHTATLVLETFFHKHNIENAIRTMLTGSAKEKNSDRASKRIKHLYVAMTRPTAFLCLALPQSKFKELCKITTIKNWFDNSFVVDKVLLEKNKM